MPETNYGDRHIMCKIRISFRNLALKDASLALFNEKQFGNCSINAVDLMLNLHVYLTTQET